MAELLEKIFGIIIPVFGYLYGIISYFYYNKLRFFIFINKVFKRKKDVNFSITFDFNGEFEDLRDLKEYFRKELTHEFRNINSSRNKEIFQLENLIVTIERSEFPDEEYQNTIFIKNSNSTYSLATKNLKLLQKVFNEIMRENSMSTTRFNFKSNFNKKNPFLNNSVTKVGVDKIKHFFMMISTSAFTSILEDEENIEVNMNQASYVTDDFNDLREVANIILAM